MQWHWNEEQQSGMGMTRIDEEGPAQAMSLSVGDYLSVGSVEEIDHLRQHVDFLVAIAKRGLLTNL